MIQMQVVDAQGDAEPGVDVAITLVRTGTPLPYGDSGLEHGLFTIVTDHDTNKIREGDGDRIHVTGAKDTRSFSAEFRITVDECRCHVHKASGPDSVVIR